MKQGLIRTTGAALGLFGAVHGCDAQVSPEYQGEPLVTLKGRVEALQLSPPEADVGVLWFESDARNGCSGPERSEIGFASGSAPTDAESAACSIACGPLPEDFASEQTRRWEDCQHACGLEAIAETIVDYHACVTGAIGQTAPVVGDFPAQFSLDMLLPPPARALMPSDTGERVALGFFVALSPDATKLAVSFEDEPPAWLLGGSETHVLVYAADPVDAESSWGLYLGGSYDVGYHLLQVRYGTRCGLPEYDVFEGDDEDDGAPHGAELVPLPDSEPMLAPDSDGASAASGSEPAPDTYIDVAGSDDDLVPDYRGVPFVCGNGVCEAGEDCRHCSDCGACDAGPGQSTGVLYGQLGYSCLSTPNTLAPTEPGSESDIRLVIGPLESIVWPEL